jgi:hypothetical protein
VSEVADKIIGSYVSRIDPLHPLAKLVEQRLRESLSIKEFLRALPENVSSDLLHIVQLDEQEAICSCAFKAKDHESASYFQSEVKLRIDLQSMACQLLPQAS